MAKLLNPSKTKSTNSPLLPNSNSTPQINHHNTIYTPSSMAGQLRQAPTPPTHQFEDHLPIMADKLGGEGLIRELCNGFELLMDREKGVITFESLRRNAALIGSDNMSDEELRSMMREGDIDGDGALNQMEFCVLMFRLSPDLMSDSQFWLEQALVDDHDFDLQHF